MVLVGGGVALVVASPSAYMLGSAGVGDTVSASVIAGTAVAALVVPLWPARSKARRAPGCEESRGAAAVWTGRAQAEDGGDSNTGSRRRRGAGGLLRAEHTGPAIAHGPGSRANSGVDDTD